MPIFRRIWGVGRGRWWRPLFLAGAAYLTVALAVNAVILVTVGVAKVLWSSPLTDDPSLPPIHNLRKVDDRLWVGGQATKEDYERLAGMGVTVVVDLIPGDSKDSPAVIRGFGLDYVWLPVHDGHAPDAATIRRFLEVVRNTEGRVYMHCGAGVGRSFSLQAAYEAALGRDPSLMDFLSIGPPTIEQAWFVFAAGPGRPTAGENPLVAAVSRFVIDGPRTAINWLVPQIF